VFALKPALLGLLILHVGVLTLVTGNTQATKTELEGAWEGEKSVVRDRERVFKPGEVMMTFSGNKLLARGIVTPDEQPLAFKLDASTTPKRFDYVSDGKTIECLYAVDGDKLTLAIPRGGPRPTAFAADASTILMTLRRKK